jgi:hypothetical protein
MLILRIDFHGSNYFGQKPFGRMTFGRQSIKVDL